MSLREEQCRKVCRILDDVLANRPTERDSLIVAVKLAFESHWIPVTERLPETYESVLVWSNGYICKDMIVCPYDDKIWYRCGKIEDDDYWMPLSCLPEPYKGVTE